MNQDEVIAQLLGALEAVSIPYMVVGSLASSVHGQARMTRDADLVIDPTPSQLDALVTALETEFYVSREAAHEALSRREMFNAIHLDSGFKIDLIVRKDRPFSLEELGRRQEAVVAGRPARIASAEDTILMKLDWARRGGSARQHDDAAAIVEVQGDRLDLAYLRRWAAELALTDLLERLLDNRPFEA